MIFIEFITRIFSYFHTILAYISYFFSLLISNNIIKLSICIGLFIFIIDYNFEIIHLLPSILGFSGEQEKEFETKSVTVSKSDYVDGNKITRSHNVVKRKRVK